MRFLIAMLAAAVFGAALAGPAVAQAPDTRPALQERLIAVAAEGGYGTEGAQLGLDRGVPQGKSVRYAFALKAGETYYVVGGCDDNCSNMALLMTDANTSGVAYSEDGNVVAHTAFGAGAHPAFTITAKKTATYSIVINVETCKGPGDFCVAGAAVFHKGGAAAKPQKFTVDAKGEISLTNDFKDELYCIFDEIDAGDSTDIDDLGEALSEDRKDLAVDKVVTAARAKCASSYNWSQREGELAVIVASTKALLVWTMDETRKDGTNYDDVTAIRASLSKLERDKFIDGSWMKNAALVAKLQAALKAKGAKDDPKVLNLGERAIGAYVNQEAAILAWVDFLRTR